MHGQRKVDLDEDVKFVITIKTLLGLVAISAKRLGSLKRKRVNHEKKENEKSGFRQD
jgi:hypothetical protein